MGFPCRLSSGVTHSYYNRTLAGYYDTDMFSITIPAFALYFLLGASRRKSLNFALGAALTLYLYRFFYASGQAITGALAVAYIGYSIGLVVLISFYHDRKWKKAISSDTSVFVFKSVLLIAFAAYAESWSYGVAIEADPENLLLDYFCCQQFGFYWEGLQLKTFQKIRKATKQKKSLLGNWNTNPETTNKNFNLPKLKISPIVLPILSIFSVYLHLHLVMFEEKYSPSWIVMFQQDKV